MAHSLARRLPFQAAHPIVIDTDRYGAGKKITNTDKPSDRYFHPPLHKTVFTMPVRYWLMKTEPTTYSIDDLVAERDQTTCWEGVRNYQARNLLRDEIKQGDRVLFYHSACKEPAVVGTALVTRDGYPDSHAMDRRSKYFDAKSDPDNPIWYMVDIQLKNKFDQPVTLATLRQRVGLKGMVLLQKGSRLSVQPVKKKEFDTVLKMAGL